MILLSLILLPFNLLLEIVKYSVTLQRRNKKYLKTIINQSWKSLKTALAKVTVQK